MIYILLSIVLVVVMLLYFRVADRFNIIDKPNQRSSHTITTIRGGGIIFPIAGLLWFLFFDFPKPWFCLGLLAVSTISFLDDIFTLSARKRIPVHLISVGLILYQLGFADFEWLWWVLGFTLIIGWINAFNFMDGINGITVFYSLVTLASFYYLNLAYNFSEMGLIILLAISALIFAFFNARKNARTFAGDVGSISMAFCLAFLMLRLVLGTGQWEYILLFSVYGIDSVVTIIQRLIKGENIFQAHRSHLYQYLANEIGLSHVTVSLIYALIQAGINIILILCIQRELISPALLFALILTSIFLMYILIKSFIIRKIRRV